MAKAIDVQALVDDSRVKAMPMEMRQIMRRGDSPLDYMLISGISTCICRLTARFPHTIRKGTLKTLFLPINTQTMTPITEYGSADSISMETVEVYNLVFRGGSHTDSRSVS
jgi:hypothetical protein